MSITEFELTVQIQPKSASLNDARLLYALEAAAMVAYDWTIATDVVIQSPNADRVMGLPSGTTIATGSEFFQLVHPADRAEVQAKIEAAFAAGSEYQAEFRLACPDGVTRWMSDRGQLNFDPITRSQRLSGVIQDITDAKRQEAERQQVEAFNRQILESSPDCVKVLDLEGRLLYMNQGGQRLLNICDFQACLNAKWIEFWTGDDRQLAQQALLTARSGGLGKFQGYCPTMSGIPKWWEVIVTPIWDASGRVERLLSISRDITDRKRSKAELQVTEQRLQAMIDNTSAAIFIKDLSGRYLLMNRECGRLFNIASAEVNGKTDDDLFPSALAESIRENDRQVLMAGAALTFEESVTFADGVHTYVAVKFPLFDETGVAYAIAGISTDITERKRLEQALKTAFDREQAAREAAEQANRLKDEFLAVLSHELRSPLNPILGWVKLLRGGRVDQLRTAEALATIERNAQLQAQLIEDLLDISRIMLGKLTLKAAPVSLAFVVSAAIETVRLAAEAKRLQLIVNLDQTITVYGDSSRLQQVVWNLLSNAVKFTPTEGRVEVTLRQSSDRAELMISDTGKGIDPNFLPYVFEHFRQEDGATTRKFGGLGLGLAIARQLVELHGGTIWADSRGEDQGAVFTVWLPLLNQDAPIQSSESAEAKTALSGVRALIVDDDNDTREFLAFLLHQNGAIVETANSAAVALQSLTQSQPDILLSDIGMPEMDGYGLIQTIRAAAYQFPAIALTAYAGELNQQQALQAGFQHHIAKPIDPDAVIAIVDQLTR